jgi:hypothetical protein
MQTLSPSEPGRKGKSVREKHGQNLREELYSLGISQRQEQSLFRGTELSRKCRKHSRSQMLCH